MFKIIRVKSDLRRVVRIDLLFNIDAFGQLNVYAKKDKMNFKGRKKKDLYFSKD